MLTQAFSTVRSETPDDVQAIEAVTVAAFREAPHTSHTEQHILRALREAGALSVSLVAECDGEVVGHVAASKVTLSDGTPDWFGLGPVSVLPAWQGSGIGSALMEACLAGLRERGARGCVLVGEPGYYQRFGFRSMSGLSLPGVPPEYVMVLDWSDERPQGEVAFHPAFEATA
ncbi:N-acetyltransferase [Halomonas sp. TRM85114]|uniref:GNAT family N-acetyltransferase n=1 Tax=Halomonas jincaotanensis TaxID=2810616 RepID=UPI001BD1EA70|nr:N-acetyltransferase [Halomonas jincaotanensis]MBS9403227.1 N-acetyltransferase [Halomonas jincaotanensis]